MEVKDEKIYSYISKGKLEIEQIMKDYTNYVFAIIKKSYAQFSKEDIEEIASDVFLILWNNQNKLDVNNSMSAYIRGITKNLIKQKCRNIRINDDITDYEEELISLSNIELNISEQEENKAIMKQLEKLKPEDRDIFVLYYYEDKPIKEICKIHNMSESKVKSKLFRIRKKLKKTLKERGDLSNE